MAISIEQIDSRGSKHLFDVPHHDDLYQTQYILGLTTMLPIFHNHVKAFLWHVERVMGISLPLRTRHILTKASRAPRAVQRGFLSCIPLQKMCIKSNGGLTVVQFFFVFTQWACSRTLTNKSKNPLNIHHMRLIWKNLCTKNFGPMGHP